MFPAPLEFDVTRDNANKHLAFSRGPHFCVGQPLAVQELVIAFEVILERMRDIALVPNDPPQRAEGFIFYSLSRLPITFTAV